MKKFIKKNPQDKKPKKKIDQRSKIFFSTSLVLGAVALSTAAGFAVYWNKYKDDERTLEGMRKADFVEVILHRANNQVEAKYYEWHNEETLLDLFENHPSDFKLNSSQWGKFLSGVFGHDPMSNHFWEIRSQSLITHHPLYGAAATWEGSVNPHTLSIGASSLHLTSSEVVDIYEVKIKNIA